MLKKNPNSCQVMAKKSNHKICILHKTHLAMKLETAKTVSAVPVDFVCIFLTFDLCICLAVQMSSFFKELPFLARGSFFFLRQQYVSGAVLSGRE